MSWDTLRVNTLLMCFKCACEASVSELDCLNRGTELFLLFRFSFVLILVFYNGNGFPFFVSGFQSMDVDANEIGSICYSYDPYFLISF